MYILYILVLINLKYYWRKEEKLRVFNGDRVSF